MLRKTFNVDLKKAIKELSKGEGSASIAEFNVIDHDGDVTVPGAFGEQHVNMLPAHDRMAPRLGKAILKEDGEFAIAEFKFNLDNDAVTAKEWYSALKFDMENGEPLQEWSYGFDILDSDFGQFQGKEVKFLRSLKVYEISPVLRGAGIGTGTLAIKDKKFLTFKEEMEQGLASLTDVKALIDRAKSLTDLRLSQNRNPMSDDNKKALEPFMALLNEVHGDCDLLKSLIEDEANGIDAVQEALARCHQTLFKTKYLSGANLQ